jgi:hypothetical protein
LGDTPFLNINLQPLPFFLLAHKYRAHGGTYNLHPPPAGSSLATSRLGNTSYTFSTYPLAQRLRNRFPTLHALKVDADYKDEFVVAEEKLGFDVQVAIRPPDIKGFVPLKGRWVVERTFTWLGRYRRLAKDYERSFHSSDSTLWFAMSHFLLRRLFPDSS